ncbi:MAG: c-type cytochrome [Bdellovibrionota bacterium]
MHLKYGSIAIKALGFCLLLPASAANFPQGMLQLLSDQQQLKLGQELFMRHCSGCHGNTARGDGPAAQFLMPKPRNIVEGSFKFKSTSYGSLPSSSDLLRIIERGLPGSSMPSFKLLPAAQREALVAYIMSLRPGWKNQVTTNIEIPAVPVELKEANTFLASALKGKNSYMELCASCHGDQGVGDGPAAAEIVDENNDPLKPANLRRKHLKSGSGARDVYRVMSAGIEGTPMPPYGDALSAEQRWDIVAYVLFMRGQEEGLYEKDFSLEAAVNKK